MIFLVSDNGASGEGGPYGSVNENRFFNMVPESLEDNLKMIDELGGPNTYNHYPRGWAMAGNTPFKMWKRYTFEGGVADPCIIHWPNGIKSKGELRNQFHHCTDFVPTVLEALQIEPPAEINGLPQSPIEGVSMLYSFNDGAAPTQKTVQYFEMLGTRAIWYQGWKAVTTHVPGAGTSDFENDVWELYDTAVDANECHNVAGQHPDILKQMIERWWVEAGKYNVLPLDDRQQERLAEPKPQLTPDRTRYVYYPDIAPVPEQVAVDVKNRSHVITAEVEIPKGGAEGILLAHGSRFGGYAFYVKKNRLVYAHNFVGIEVYTIKSDATLPDGKATLRFQFTKTGENHGKGELFIEGQKVGEGEIPHTVPIAIALAGEGLCCGRDVGMPVTDDYESPFAFSGKIKQVVVELRGLKRRDLEREMAAAMARD
jgi:Sulfatase